MCLNESLDEGEGMWDDVDDVLIIQPPYRGDEENPLYDDDVVEDPEPDDPYEELEYSSEDNWRLSRRDTYAKNNLGLSSFKPLAPKNTGGPQSGRSPGGNNTAYSSVY